MQAVKSVPVMRLEEEIKSGAMSYEERKKAIEELDLRNEYAEGIGERSRMGQQTTQHLRKMLKAQNIYETHSIGYR